MNTINLDYTSGNPLLPEVKNALIEAIKKDYGNPSSAHQLGVEAAEEIEKAREKVAKLINASPGEIIFTSCGTESNNHAIKGIAFAEKEKGKHIITSDIEHNAVLKPIRTLRAMGFGATSVSVDQFGRIKPEDVLKAIRDDTMLISVMHANNEIGTIQPIKEIAHIARGKKIVFHCDAVTSVGVVPVDVQDLGVDLLSFAANQFNGPSGVGGLYVRKGTSLWPLLDGGGQENKRRGGTENLLGIIGMGVAAEIGYKEMESRINHLKRIKERLTNGLKEHIDDIIFNGDPDHSLPNLISVSIKYIEGESIVLMLDEENIAVATKSACASGSLRASHVLIAIGRDYADAQGTLVITYGRDTNENDIDRFLEVLKKAVDTLRKMSPLYQKK